MNDYTFGNFLYELRTGKGLSQAELGEMMGVSNKAVSKWEMGVSKPRPEMLVSLASFFGVTVEELMAGRRSEEEKKKQPDDNFVEKIGFLLREYRRKRRQSVSCTVACVMLFIGFILFVAIADRFDVVRSAWAAFIGLSALFSTLLCFVLIWGFFASAQRQKRMMYAAFPERMQEIKEMLKPISGRQIRLSKTEKIVLVVCFSFAVLMQFVLCFHNDLPHAVNLAARIAELIVWVIALGCWIVCIVRNLRKK